jgi:hypothetical protein
VEDFSKVYLENEENAQVLVYNGMPYETGLMHEMHRRSLINYGDEPSPLVDVGSMLLMTETPSLEDYVAKHRLSLRTDGIICSPLVTAMNVAQVYCHLCGWK